MRRSGTADLPLHGGHVPRWLSDRMTQMGRAILFAIAEEYGPDEILRRISDPFWFQSLGAVMGMDWHSSGITTSVMGALKRAVNPVSHEIGLFICGGRGRQSRKTPDELMAVSDKQGLGGHQLVRASRLSAKVDNTCIQDGFQLYLHSFIVSGKGEWAVVQQGMNQQTAMARRYHWHSNGVKSFVSDPHTGVIGHNQGIIINLSDGRAENARNSILNFVCEPPELQLKEIRHLKMTFSHQVTPMDVNAKRLGAVLALAYEQQFKHFTDMLLLKGIGPRTMQSLALVSEVIYGTPSRFDDPARFAFAHGGKDGSPFPVPLKVYDESIRFLSDAVKKAKIGHTDKLQGLKKSELMTRVIETRSSPVADIPKVIQREWDHSHLYNGRTVKGPVKKNIQPAGSLTQLSLFHK